MEDRCCSEEFTDGLVNAILMYGRSFVVEDALKRYSFLWNILIVKVFLCPKIQEFMGWNRCLKMAISNKLCLRKVLAEIVAIQRFCLYLIISESKSIGLKLCVYF